MRKYTDPQAAGYLLEAKACEKVSKELRRLAEKYQRHVDKEQKGREAEFEAVMGYSSEDEIRDAYGWSFITEAQMERYIDIFRTGQAALEQHTPTCDELVPSTSSARGRQLWSNIPRPAMSLSTASFAASVGRLRKNSGSGNSPPSVPGNRLRNWSVPEKLPKSGSRT